MRGWPHLKDMTFHYCDFWSDTVFLINKVSTPFIFIIIPSHICGSKTLKSSIFLSLGLLNSCTTWRRIFCGCVFFLG
jgi:hypothetical protein